MKNADVLWTVFLAVAFGFMAANCGGPEFQSELSGDPPDSGQSLVEAGPEVSPPADHIPPIVEAGAQEASGPASAVDKADAGPDVAPDVGSGGTIHPLPDAEPTSDVCVTQPRGCGGTVYPDGPRVDGAQQTYCTPNAGMFEWAEHFMGYGSGGQPLWAAQGIGVIPPNCGCNQTCECMLWYNPGAICHGWNGTPICWIATSGAMQAACP